MQRVFAVLESAGALNSPILPTLLYEEGWLLRVVISLASEGVDCLPLRIADGARWLSEARLYSAFQGRFRGDPLAETPSHADGAIGHLGISLNTKSGLMLNPCGTQFVIIEAKISSPLSQGTTRAKYFDQAARSVACMAETLRRCGQPLNQWRSLAFYVFAPKTRIDAGIFAGQMAKASIAAKIERRIGEYPPEERQARIEFQQRWVTPLLERLTVDCVSWESVIGRVRLHDAAMGNDLQQFYDKALIYNNLPNGEGEWRFRVKQVGR